jgi:hypothetical protein
MSNEKQCEACAEAPGKHVWNSDPADKDLDIDGSMVCDYCYMEEGARTVRDAIRARRQRTAEPRFVDRNGVEIRIGDRIRNDDYSGVVQKLWRKQNGETAVDFVDRSGGTTGGWGLEKFWTRIDPPADEGKPAVTKRPGFTVHTRDSLIAALLSESGHTPPPEGYGDFERDRVTRLVDAQATLLGKFERDMAMVKTLGPMFCRTEGDCEP